MKEMELVAPRLGLVLQSLPIRNADEVETAFQAAIQGNAEGIVTMDDPLVQSQRARVIELASCCMTVLGHVSRGSPVQASLRNCTNVRT